MLSDVSLKGRCLIKCLVNSRGAMYKAAYPRHGMGTGAMNGGETPRVPLSMCPGY